MASDPKLTTEVLPVRPAAVYLIQRYDRNCFKLGTSLDPLQRARSLPEHHAKLLDLESSLALWLPNKTRAHEVENGMHKCLTPFSHSPGHTRSGFSEWFSPEAYVPAMRMLQQVPKDPHGAQTLGLRPLVEGGAEVIDGPMLTPLDRWWILEDLFVRVATMLPVAAAYDGIQWSMTIERFRNARGGKMHELRMRVLDTGTYGWSVGVAKGDVVDLLDYDGDALVLRFAPSKKIRRWVEGDTLNLLMSALMTRLTARFGKAQEVPHG